MDSLEYKIAIPSYKRAETIGKKTLAYLKECNILMENVYVFVADADEFEAYKHHQALGLNVVIGTHTLCGQRNFISRFFRTDDKVVCIDDDIEGIYIKLSDKKFEKTFDLDTCIKLGFTECIKSNTKLWGINAVLNALFMKDSVSDNLKYIVGCFWGYIVDKSPELAITLEDKEDFERTLLFYHKFNAVVRLNMYAPKTNYYKEQGGMQETRTPERVTSSAYNLLERFPQYCTLNTTKKSENTEIRLYHNRKAADAGKAQTSLF